ncbi:hypothetical protein J6590_074486 [Homalodisca vitripennis]|nr:hypothetical protein J6590_074486 [Homalodisca vitripennis]
MSFLLKPTHFHQEYKAENDEVLPIRTDGGSPSTSVGGRISCELHNCLKTYLVKPSEFFELGKSLRLFSSTQHEYKHSSSIDKERTSTIKSGVNLKSVREAIRYDLQQCFKTYLLKPSEP